MTKTKKKSSPEEKKRRSRKKKIEEFFAGATPLGRLPFSDSHKKKIGIAVARSWQRRKEAWERDVAAFLKKADEEEGGNIT